MFFCQTMLNLLSYINSGTILKPFSLDSKYYGIITFKCSTFFFTGSNQYPITSISEYGNFMNNLGKEHFCTSEYKFTKVYCS